MTPADSRPDRSQPVSLEGRLSATRLGGWVRILETWFDDEPESLEGFDLWIAHRRSRPVSDRGWLYFYTIRNDLSATPEALLAGMRKSTMKGIKAAMNTLGFSCAFSAAPSAAELAAFADFYDDNPLGPGQAPLDRGWLARLGQAGLLHLSRVQDGAGEILVQHALQGHRRTGIVQPFLQVSTYKTAADPGRVKAIGDANRLLYYSEFLHFKELGFHTYDHNGWYSGLEDAKRLQINLFKEGFGGAVWHGYDCQEAVSLRGRLFLALKQLKRRLLRPEELKDLERRRQLAPARPEEKRLNIVEDGR